MTVIRLFADDQKLSVAVAPKIASGDRNSVQIHVSFSGNWSNYEKSAVFYTSWDKTVYEVMLSDNKCLIPHEVLSMNGDLFIGIRGVDTNGGAVKTTTVLKYRIEKGAPMGDATSVEPTPDVYQQILMRLAEIKEGSTVTEEQITQVVSDYLEKNHILGTSPARIGEVELLSDRWVGSGNLYSQVVSIDGVTEKSQVDITPSVEQLVIFYEKDLAFVTENEEGVVTVYAIGQKPQNDYRLQVTITEVTV